MKRPLRLLLLAVVVAAAASGTATTQQASAAPPCWKQLIQDWYDGRIDGVYPIPVYQQAIDHLPTDVGAYGSAADDIRRALQERIQNPPKKGQGNDCANGRSSSSAGGPPSSTGSPGRNPGGGPVGDTLRNIGPKDAFSVPIPLIVLGSIAALLLVAGSTGFVLRRLQARRVPIRPSSSTPHQ